MWLVRRSLRIVMAAGTVVSLVAVMGVSIAMAIGYANGWRALSVQSDSMRPVFRRGDLMITRPDIAAPLGAVVSYHSPLNGRMVISHRLVGRRGNLLITAGDALRSRDQPFDRSRLVGRAVILVPSVGRPLDWLHRPLGLALMVYLPAGIICMVEVRRLYGRQTEPYRLAGYQR